ncbi:MAG TPA: hypothetical protein VIH61_03880 [Waddliaceae bacterium]
MESKEKIKARQQRYVQSPKGRISRYKRNNKYAETLNGRAFILYSSAKQRAKNQKLPFSITHELVKKCLIECNGSCQVTGTPLSFELRSDVSQNPFAPSIDQKISGNGYTLDNIQIVAVWYNRMKSDLTDAEAQQILLECHHGLLQKH